MAKVTLTIDDCEDGVKLTLDSDPPFDMSDEGENTDAQMAGLIAMRAIQDAGEVDPPDAGGQCECDGWRECDRCRGWDDRDEQGEADVR